MEEAASEPPGRVGWYGQGAVDGSAKTNDDDVRPDEHAPHTPPLLSNDRANDERAAFVIGVFERAEFRLKNHGSRFGHALAIPARRDCSISIKVTTAPVTGRDDYGMRTTG